MHSLIRRCKKCSRYTLRNECPSCNSITSTTVPMRYSVDDRYGKYRRMLKRANENHRGE